MREIVKNDRFVLIVEFDAPSPLDELRRTAIHSGAQAIIEPDGFELRLIVRSSDIGVLEILRQEAIDLGGTVIEYPADLIPPPTQGGKK